MKEKTQHRHSVDSLAALLLFGLFVLFLLILLLFSAKAYRVSVEDLSENQNLHTAATYIITKFRQHDNGGVSTGSLGELDALCFREELAGKEYTTYLYLQDNSLKELFTASGNPAAVPEMGTVIASLADFQTEELTEGFFRICLTDSQGQTSSFLLHPGSSGSHS